MILEQIKQQITSNTAAIKKLQSEISKLSQENVKLNNGYNDKLIEYFKEYIELGTTYNVNKCLYLNGVQTGVKVGEYCLSPNFNDGDTFEFIKKNPKSIVIKCTKKVHATYNSGSVLSARVTKRIENNPGWTFRIETESLYHNLIKDEVFKDSFTKYVSRKEALEVLGI